MNARHLASVLAVAAALAAGCAGQPTGSAIIVDPTTTQKDVGGSDDVLEVSQKMVGSMRRDPDVLQKPSKLIFLDEDGITVDPNLHGYNARMLYNQFSSTLNNVAGSEFKFIDRKAVAREAQRQLKGEVKTSGVSGAPAGADMVLNIELIAQQGGATTTVQYNFKLTGLDGIELWRDNALIVKKR